MFIVTSKVHIDVLHACVKYKFAYCSSFQSENGQWEQWVPWLFCEMAGVTILRLYMGGWWTLGSEISIHYWWVSCQEQVSENSIKVNQSKFCHHVHTDIVNREYIYFGIFRKTNIFMDLLVCIQQNGIYSIYVER